MGVQILRPLTHGIPERNSWLLALNPLLAAIWGVNQWMKNCSSLSSVTLLSILTPLPSLLRKWCLLSFLKFWWLVTQHFFSQNSQPVSFSSDTLMFYLNKWKKKELADKAVSAAKQKKKKRTVVVTWELELHISGFYRNRWHVRCAQLEGRRMMSP